MESRADKLLEKDINWKREEIKVGYCVSHLNPTFTLSLFTISIKFWNHSSVDQILRVNLTTSATNFCWGEMQHKIVFIFFGCVVYW